MEGKYDKNNRMNPSIFKRKQMITNMFCRGFYCALTIGCHFNRYLHFNPRFVLECAKNRQMEVIHQLITRGYTLHGHPLERPLPAGQEEARAMVYHLSRDDTNNEKRSEEAVVDQAEVKKSITDEDDCQMKECKVNDKSDSVSLIQVVIKKGLK